MVPEPTVADYGEKRLLREVVKPLLPGLAGGIPAGDDAAVVPFPAGGRLVISTDKIPESLLAVEFGVMSRYEQGRYLVAVSVSDIAAMGARPLGVLLTLGLPPDTPVEDVRELVRGAVAGGDELGAPVLGGDTGAASAPSLSSCAFGHLDGPRALTRAGAAPGDLLAVSGPVGGFGAALAYFAQPPALRQNLDVSEAEALRQRLVHPVPRVDLGPDLACAAWCTSGMDVTDGLGQSLLELAEASGVGLRIDGPELPLHPLARIVADLLELDPYVVALGIGLDLELLVTVDDRVQAERAGLIVFGRVVAEPGVTFSRDGRAQEPLPIAGWQHFSGDAHAYVASASTEQVASPT